MAKYEKESENRNSRYWDLHRETLIIVKHSCWHRKAGMFRVCVWMDERLQIGECYVGNLGSIVRDVASG